MQPHLQRNGDHNDEVSFSPITLAKIPRMLMSFCLLAEVQAHPVDQAAKMSPPLDILAPTVPCSSPDRALNRARHVLKGQ